MPTLATPFSLALHTYIYSYLSRYLNCYPKSKLVIIENSILSKSNNLIRRKSASSFNMNSDNINSKQNSKVPVTTFLREMEFTIALSVHHKNSPYHL